MDEKAGEKGLRSSGKSVFWSYNCEYNKYIDSWAINSDDFWSYLRLVQIGAVNAVWDLTLNPKFCKDYIKKFEDALKANGFKSDIHLDAQSNNITTFFEKQNFRYMVSIKQTKEFYVVAFFSTETKF